MGDFFISLDELANRIGTHEAPLILDVRRREVFDAAPRILPTARWRRHTGVGEWASRLPPPQPSSATARTATT